MNNKQLQILIEEKTLYNNQLPDQKKKGNRLKYREKNKELKLKLQEKTILGSEIIVDKIDRNVSDTI